MVHQQRTDPLEGAIVDGRYVVHSRLARGGMSTVYVATDLRLDRRVALKVLYPHLAEEPGFIDRFEQEAKSAARLSHPHVVGVLDQGVDDVDGQPVAYLVMEFVSGRTLRDVLREHGRLTPRHALVLLDAVVEGLAAAHHAGLIHRDVKPENVLLSDGGQVKIADFGLARAVSATTGTATLVGTAAYLSPELVLGRPAEAQSDIYSTGVMLYELITGRQPFTGETPIQVAIQHAQSDVPAPSALLPGLAPDIDELVQWCTSRNPEARPVDGAALLGELRHIRTMLSDEHLDFSPTDGAAPAPVQDQLTAVVVPRLPLGEARTEAIREGFAASHGRASANDASAWTEVLPSAASGDRTRVVRSGPDATRVIGTTPVMPPPAPPPPERALSKRQQARQAQRPEKTLHSRIAHRGLRVLVVLLVLLAGLIAGVGWLFGAGPAGVVSLPDVANVPLAEARAALDAEGLAAPTTAEVFDETIGAGLVVGTDPRAFSEVRRFERVELIVSKGPELFRVPNLLGSTETDAAAQLREAGLSVGGVVKEYDESVPSGDVIQQVPEQGAERRRNSSVDLVVSLGPAPIAVPDVVGLSEQDAVATLKGAGLDAEVSATRDYSATVPPGAVLAQEPSGTEVRRGTPVTLTLSRGPRMVKVPSVFSLPEARAVAALEAAGFTVQVDYTFGSAVLGLVAAQSSSGEQPEGTAIRITVT